MNPLTANELSLLASINHLSKRAAKIDELYQYIADLQKEKDRITSSKEYRVYDANNFHGRSKIIASISSNYINQVLDVAIKDAENEIWQNMQSILDNIDDLDSDAQMIEGCT